MITREDISVALSYEEYCKLVEGLLQVGKTTGLIQTEEYVSFARINVQRMKRLDKTLTLMPEFAEVCRGLKKVHYFVILTEGWCGDAAQNVPVFAALQKQCEALQVKILLRDDHPEVMDQYLTKGSRSIPKVICIEKDSMKEKFVWGPRPHALQALVEELLAKKVSKEEKILFVQKWYNVDKTLTMQKELLELLRSL